MLKQARIGAKAHAAVLKKAAVTLLCVALMPWQFVFPDQYATGHLLFHFSHANVFHLAANLICLWIIRFPIKYAWAFGIASLASLIPAPTWQWSSLSFEVIPTCGLSGMLFAAITIAFAEKTSFRVMARYLLLPTIITGLMPNINLLYHLYVIAIAYLITKKIHHQK